MFVVNVVDNELSVSNDLETRLAKYVSEYLGWPFIALDPSHIARRGMEKIQAEANTLFGMIVASEGLVVLLDEFDELVRDRTLDGADAFSRFLTTAMLPKLAGINARRRIVFLVATIL